MYAVYSTLKIQNQKYELYHCSKKKTAIVGIQNKNCHC